MIVCLSLGGGAHADETCCPRPNLLLDEARLRVLAEEHDGAAIGVVVGAALFGIGQVIVIARMASAGGSESALGLVPIMGPLVLIGRQQQSPEWMGGLMFATWLEATGVLIAAAAGQALWKANVRLNAAVNGDCAALGISGRF
jgi:hypothetical protein